MLRTGVDRLLDDPGRLAGRRYALLTHHAAVTAALEPVYLALAALGASSPALLLAPEHGLFAVEQDMVPAAEGREPATGLPVVSLYGSSAESLRPSPALFADLDLLLVDLQDVGARYYTYAASAVWAAEVAIGAGCQVWVLDRPNPLGGLVVEGNLPDPGLESFVSAFRLPVRHGLTLGELALLEARRRGWPADAVEVLTMQEWQRSHLFTDWRRPWIAPSPNVPTFGTALVYPGGCLVEATELSEGRGTTRPFELLGAPGIDPHLLARRLEERDLPGLRCLPVRFRPQFHKHAGRVCGGVEILVTDPHAFQPFRFGLHFLEAVRELAPDAFAWRRAPYEFVSDRPAIDLLAGSDAVRRALDTLESLAGWIDALAEQEAAFLDESQSVWLYT
jgi:uncharacterized protein YbbC (DUF1343 family)